LVSVTVGVAVGLEVGEWVAVEVDMGVKVTVEVSVTVGVGVTVEVTVTVGEFVMVGVFVTVGVGVSVGLRVRVRVGVEVEDGVDVGEDVGVGLWVDVRLGVAVEVLVTVGEAVAVGLGVLVRGVRRTVLVKVGAKGIKGLEGYPLVLLQAWSPQSSRTARAVRENMCFILKPPLPRFKGRGTCLGRVPMGADEVGHILADGFGGKNKIVFSLHKKGKPLIEGRLTARTHRAVKIGNRGAGGRARQNFKFTPEAPKKVRPKDAALELVADRGNHQHFLIGNGAGEVGTEIIKSFQIQLEGPVGVEGLAHAGL
jgi:hypothetical protein